MTSMILAALVVAASASGGATMPGPGRGVTVAGAEVTETMVWGGRPWWVRVWARPEAHGCVGGVRSAGVCGLSALSVGLGAARAGAHLGMFLGGGLLVGAWRSHDGWSRGVGTLGGRRPRARRAMGRALLGAGVGLWIVQGVARVWDTRPAVCGAGEPAACSLGVHAGAALAGLTLAGAGLALGAAGTRALNAGPRLRALRVGPLGLSGGAGLSISGRF